MYYELMATEYKKLKDSLIDGSYHPLIQHIWLKRHLLKANDPAHQTIKSVAVFEGGGMRGVYGSGVIVGLEQLGLNDVFDDLVGISAGACNAAYLAAHQAIVGPSVFYDDLPKGRFVSTRRFGDFMNMELLADIFRNKKPLDQQALRASRSELYIGMTDVEAARAKYLKLSYMPKDFDVVNALIASSAIPGYTKKIVKIEGRHYSDGLSTCHDPIGFAISELGATDILVVLNIPLDKEATKLTSFEKARSRLLFKDYSQDFVNAHQSRHYLNGLVASYEYPENVTIGVLCPKKVMVGRGSMNSKKLKQVAEVATHQTLDIFTQNKHKRYGRRDRNELEPNQTRTDNYVGNCEGDPRRNHGC
jgi:predicted patatin/cPLA2 family phospholipase